MPGFVLGTNATVPLFWELMQQPPGVFWLQKTLLATSVALTVLLEMVCDFIAVFKRAEISSSFHLYNPNH